MLMSYIPMLSEDHHVVVTLNGPNVFERNGYEYIELNVRPVKGLIHAVKSLRRIIIDKRIDVVHAHSYWTNIISRLATPRKTLLVNHYHFADYDTLRHKRAVRRMIWLDRIISHKMLVRVAVSEYVEQILRAQFSKTPIWLIPNFITCAIGEEPNPAASGEVLKVVAVGNCNLEKNYSLIIDAFKELQGSRIQLDIYGGGPRLEWYREEAKKAGLSNVRFLGSVPGVRQKFSGYHLFLSASVSETFGIAVLEAVCAKLPLLISDIAAFKEVAPNGTIFFDPNDKRDLIKKLQPFLNDSGLPINKRSYEATLQKYSANAFVGKLKSLYLKH